MSKQYGVGCKSLDENGRGIVSFNNSKFTVKGLLPGEKGIIELVYKGSNTKAETKAKLISVEKASKDRVRPDCPHFGKCGGCNLQHLSYEAQTEYKEKRVRKLFEADGAEILPIVAMDNPYRYRNKCYATFSYGERGKIVSGIYEENSHKVVPAKSCLIQDQKADEVVRTIRHLMKDTNTPPYNEDKHTGVLRHVYIRVAESTGDMMVVLVTGKAIFSGRKHLVEKLVAEHPQIKTVIHNINDKQTNFVLGDRSEVVYGKGYIEDTLLGLKFRISEKTFYQVNPVQTEHLYSIALELADLQVDDDVIDLFCGIGTISLIAARKCASVIGVELNPESIKDAKFNAKENDIVNAEFFAEDAGQFMSRYVKEKGKKPNVVFLDPPRSGCNEDVLTELGKLGPEKIVYVSCCPETQKRDTDILKRYGYKVKKARACDMFPQTAHVENVVLLSKLR